MAVNLDWRRIRRVTGGDPLRRPDEVAGRLGVHRKTIVDWLRSGRMEGIQTPGGQWRIRESEVCLHIYVRERSVNR